MSLTLYHSVESTCAQKVRLVLSEKKLQWSEQILNLRKGEQFAPEYLRLNPKGVVPTLVHDGQVIRESSVINEYLDDAFPQPPLKPADVHARARMRLIVKAFDDEVHPSVGILTYAIVLRHQMNALKSPRELEAHFEKIVDPMRRERQRGTHERGLRASAARNACATLARIANELEATLEGGAWLAGTEYSLADAAALPYIKRMASLKLGGIWTDESKLAAWIERAESRSNCRTLVDPWGTQAFAEMVASHVTAERSGIAELLADIAPAREPQPSRNRKS